MKFYDQVYASLYQREADQQQMITLFSLLAIVISLVGVFGLIIFEAEHRRKEIGVRKVYGATTRQILWMFGKSYLALCLVSSVIATPVAWYAVSRWMEQFNHASPSARGSSSGRASLSASSPRSQLRCRTIVPPRRTR